VIARDLKIAIASKYLNYYAKTECKSFKGNRAIGCSIKEEFMTEQNPKFPEKKGN
jgi:hypothetical protein